MLNKLPRAQNAGLFLIRLVLKILFQQCFLHLLSMRNENNICVCNSIMLKNNALGLEMILISKDW